MRIIIVSEKGWIFDKIRLIKSELTTWNLVRIVKQIFVDNTNGNIVNLDFGSYDKTYRIWLSLCKCNRIEFLDVARIFDSEVALVQVLRTVRILAYARYVKW